MTDIICRQVASEDELAECFEIRRKVFVQEQRLFEHSDKDEYDACAIHLAAFNQNRIVGTVRVYQDADGMWWGGRLAVLKKYRGRAGRELVLSAELSVKKHGAEKFFANILAENLNFFINIGWCPIGGGFLLYGKSHCLVMVDLQQKYSHKP
jgi:putative N-acetyltransferase (TIGR04045 family)